MRQGAARGALELGALGVVFGDIGTSPLYAFNPKTEVEWSKRRLVLFQAAMRE